MISLLIWCGFVGWILVIFCLSSLTSSDLEIMPSELLAMDKLVHALAFACGGFLLGAALRRTSRLRGGWLFIAIIVGIGLYGAFDELHQLYTPGRSGADFKDWLADMVGGTVASFVYCFFYGQARPQPSADPDSATP